MTLTLHGAPYSTCTRLVALICKEKQIPFNIHAVDLAKGEHKAPGFVAVQPFGQIPYIDDDGFVLYESRAIARYLIRKYPNQGTPGLIPTDPKEEALFEQAASIEAFNFNPFAAGIAYEKVFKLRRGLQTNEQVLEERLTMLKAKLDAYEVILGKQKYLAGNNVTLADLSHLPYGTLLSNAGYSKFIAVYPRVMVMEFNLSRWWNDLTNRPAWKEVQNLK
ncbi:glutathione S-transferase-like protein [Pisolithus marmoratus]|nr:glutathione S-transferase-like protein [Pisolithus marmoratus]